jgi:choline kinase
MKAIILLAGKGNRLNHPMPKCLHKIGTRSILQRQLEALKFTGVKELVTVLGYKKDTLYKEIENIWHDKFTVVDNTDYENTNTSYSLYLARQFMDSDFIYLNGDVVFRPDLITRLIQAQGKATLAIEEKRCGDEEVKVVVKDRIITNITKKVDPNICLGEFIGIGLFRKQMLPFFRDALVELIEEDHLKKEYFEAALDKITHFAGLQAVDVTDIPCIEIDFPEDLQKAQSNPQLYDKL